MSVGQVRRGPCALVASALAASAAVLTCPSEVEAQAFFIDGHVDQAYADAPLSSPLGFSVAVGRTSIVGPLGLQAGFRTLYEGGAESLGQHCSLGACAEGPFDQTYATRMIWIGLSYDFRNRTDVYMNLGLNAGTNRQVEHLTHLDTGEELEDSLDSETILGGSLDLRLRPFLGPLRPAFTARYDRIFGSECTPDAACAPDRDVWSLSVGLSWVAPVR